MRLHRVALGCSLALAGLIASTGVAVAAPVARTAAAAPTAAGSFHAVTPTRLLDTRYGTGTGGRIAPLVAGGADLDLTVTGQGGVASTNVAAVVLTVTAVAPSSAGPLTVYPAGSSVPTVSSLNFYRGRNVTNSAVVQVGQNGAVAFHNGGYAGTTVDVVADVTGYYQGGTATADGGFTPVTPTRLLDTRYAVGVSTRTPVPARSGVPLAVVGKQVGTQHIPAGVSAVVLNVTVADAKSGGYLAVYGNDGPPPALGSNLNFTTGQVVANTVYAQVGPDGAVFFDNASYGSVDVIADVSGYLLGGGPDVNGTFGSVPLYRALDTRTSQGGTGPIAPGASATIRVAGRGWVVPSAVSAVVVNLTVPVAQAPGYFTAYAGGSQVPATSSLNFSRGQTLPNLVVVPVSSSGTISIYNDKTFGRAEDMIVDVMGYVLGSDLTASASSSTSHYLGAIASDGLQQTGQADCRADVAGSPIHVIDVGAQTVTSPLSTSKPGVAVALTSPTERLSYPALVGQVETYLTGLASCSIPGTTLIVATSNDGANFTAYPAAVGAATDEAPAARPYAAALQKGTDWAQQVISPLVAWARTNAPDVTVAGGNDIEASFAGTATQVRTWISHYLATKPATPLYDIGSLDACPSTWGATTDCLPVNTTDTTTGNTVHSWTIADYKSFFTPTTGQVVALPQIYLPIQALQWANMKQKVAAMTFAGVLTENGRAGLSLTGPQASASLRAALQAFTSSTVTGPTASTDLAAN